MTPLRPVPTRVDDVLILRTTIASRTVHAVGRVTTDGQQDFCGQPDVTYVRDPSATMDEATALLQPGRRLLMRDLDAGDWSEIARHADTRMLFRPRAGKADVRPAPRLERTS